MIPVRDFRKEFGFEFRSQKITVYFGNLVRSQHDQVFLKIRKDSKKVSMKYLENPNISTNVIRPIGYSSLGLTISVPRDLTGVLQRTFPFDTVLIKVGDNVSGEFVSQLYCIPCFKSIDKGDNKRYFTLENKHIVYLYTAGSSSNVLSRVVKSNDSLQYVNHGRYKRVDNYGDEYVSYFLRESALKDNMVIRNSNDTTIGGVYWDGDLWKEKK